jgi:hypothetical protein
MRYRAISDMKNASVVQVKAVQELIFLTSGAALEEKENTR